MGDVIINKLELEKIIFSTLSAVVQINNISNSQRQGSLKTQKKLSTAEASKLIGVSKATLYSSVAMRSIPFVREGGRIVFYEEGLKEWDALRKAKKEVSHG